MGNVTLHVLAMGKRYSVQYRKPNHSSPTKGGFGTAEGFGYSFS